MHGCEVWIEIPAPDFPTQTKDTSLPEYDYPPNIGLCGILLKTFMTEIAIGFILKVDAWYNPVQLYILRAIENRIRTIK